MTCSINKYCILSVSVTILAQILTCEVRFQALPRKFSPVACQSKFASADKFASARKSSPPPSMELDLDVPDDVLKEARDRAMCCLEDNHVRPPPPGEPTCDVELHQENKASH